MTLRNFRATASKSAVAIACLAAVCAPAMAQDASPADVRDDTGVIIVTAQRNAQNLQDVPVSLTAVTDDVLDSRQINDTSQLFLAAPTVQFSGEDNLSIRGVGTLGFSPTVESSVGIAVDEVNLGRPALGLGAFDDVARVEVLNGPQGLLFGKNSSAGLLNIVTRRPELGVFGGYAKAEVNWRDTTPDNGFGVILRGTINAPLGERAAVRINTRYTSQDSIVKYIGTGNPDERAEDWGVRVKGLVEVSPEFEVYLIGEYAQQRGRDLQTYGLAAPGGEIIGPLTAAGIVASPNNLYNNSEAPNYLDTQLASLQGTFTYTLPNDWQIINVTAWKQFLTEGALDADRVQVNYLSRNFTNADFSQFSTELRLAIPDTGPVSGQLGLYYFASQEDAYRQLAGMLGIPSFVASGFPFCVNAPVVRPGPPPNCGRRNDYAIGRDTDTLLKLKSYAAFGQLNFAVTNAMTLIAGARITRDEIDIDSTQMQSNYFVGLGAPGNFVESASDTNFSYKLGAQYDVTDDVMFYGYYATGYKGPAFNEVFIPGINTQVRPETGETFEIGLKSAFARNTVVFNLSGFIQNFSDYQVQSFNVANQTFLLQNAAELETKGIEAQLTLRPVHGLTIDANATYLDAVFASFPGAECYPGQPLCGAGNTFDATGQQLPASAKFTSTVQGMYSFPLSNALDGFVEANWYHRSPINFNISGNPATEIPTTDYFGASIGFETRNLRFSVFCRNCNDQRRPEGIINWAGDAQNFGLTSTAYQWGLNSVRNWGISASYNF